MKAIDPVCETVGSNGVESQAALRTLEFLVKCSSILVNIRFEGGTVAIRDPRVNETVARRWNKDTAAGLALYELVV